MPDRNDTIARLHREAPLTDVHAHPSLKAYLFRRNLWRHYWSGKAFDPFSSRTDFKMLSKGKVGVIWSALYLPERQLFQQCFLLRAAAFLLVPAYRKIMKGDLFERTIEMMDQMEREIARKPDRIELATSVADLERIRRAGKIAVVHTVEGAHVLGGDLSRLDVLADRGVAMITLAHFFYNRLANQVVGIPHNMLVSKLCRFDFGTGGQPLTPLGRALVERMSELSMIVDVAHCTRDARREIYDVVGSSAPVVASHVGVAALNPDPYNLTDDEIERIARSGGAVGVIFMTHWLSSNEPRNGLPLIWKTMRHVRDVTGSWEHVMLGTDLDGFTDPPDDVRDASRLGRVTRMLLEQGLTEREVMQVLGGNALRVLRLGWR